MRNRWAFHASVILAGMNDSQRLAMYLQAWHLSNPQLLEHTATSTLYTVSYGGETCVLKLLNAQETDEQRGALALHLFQGNGAVQLLQADTHAQLLEYAAGAELVTLVEAGADTEATYIIAEVITRLHAVPQTSPPSGLMALDRWFAALFRQAATDKKAGIASIYVRGAARATQLFADSREQRILHGDIHHRNIRHSARGWLAFDPKGLVGERAYECANTLCNPVIPQLVHNDQRLLSSATILADLLKLDRSRILAWTYAYACLNASWWLAINSVQAINFVEWSLAIAERIEPHLD
ncbi:aminoglycoside phosphotransferase family protein [Herpetosiphon geysericola]|uniref:aminoglycoside phosphotransferase family protein n=1 Tax=Herpetosiphon geysericola TaxID=70996 RepID=UPI0006C8ED2E|nr:aminoglycoside phosphotransferase family protein [Herpetosiphon geysericola]